MLEWCSDEVLEHSDIAVIKEVHIVEIMGIYTQDNRWLRVYFEVLGPSFKLQGLEVGPDTKYYRHSDLDDYRDDSAKGHL